MNVTQQNTCIISGNQLTNDSEFTTKAADVIELPVPAGKVGTLNPRTGNSTGTLVLSAGHGLVENDVINLWWEGGYRLDVTVGSVSGVNVPISGGSGTSLPVQDTVVVATLVTSQEFQNDPTLMSHIFIQWAANSSTVVADAEILLYAADAVAYAIQLENTEIVDLPNDQPAEDWEQFVDETLQGNPLQKVAVLNTTANAGTLRVLLLAT